MSGDTRELEALRAVLSLVDDLLDDVDIVEFLTELTERCMALLDVATAGLLLAGPDDELHLMTTTAAGSQELELFQLQGREGPCRDSYRTGRPLSIADLRTAGDVWPHFVTAAEQVGIVSAHAIPVRAAGTVLGTLGLFGTTPDALDAPDLLVGQTLAHVASVAIVQERAPAPEAIAPRLLDTLRRQVVVEQARGFVHDRLDVPTERALRLLRTYARQHGAHLSDVCRTLMTDPAGRDRIVVGLRAIDDGVA